MWTNSRKFDEKFHANPEISDANAVNMDACEIANILAKELLFHQLAQLDGLNSGVPTRTTPTITPTTLRNIEQTFIELQCQAEQHTSQAGFVPPPIAAINTLGVQSSVGFTGGTLRVSPGPTSSSCSIDSAASPSPSPAPPSNSSSSSATTTAASTTRRRGMGGRRPNSHQNLSPEEEERRNVRRERNKMAAARCRKRRLDHTNELIEETEGLERKKQSLQSEIRQLQQDREELQFLLETHRACCRLRQNSLRETSPPDVKPVFQALLASEGKRMDSGYTLEEDGVRVKVEMVESQINLDSDIFTSPQANKKIMLSSANPQVVTTMASQQLPVSRPPRPNFLNVPLSLTPAQAHSLKNNNPNLSEVAGVAITTPSNGIPFNFDSLMEGGTGLTPVQPCATQQQKTQPEIGSPDGMGNNKLVIL